MVVDGTHILGSNSRQRTQLGQTLKRSSALIEKYCAGNAIVVPSVIARGIVTAVHWMAPPRYPYHICKSMLEGEVWAQSQLAKLLKGQTHSYSSPHP